MKNQELMLTALFMVLGAVLVKGLIAIPVIEEAEARSSTAEENNKGQQGEKSSNARSHQGGIDT